MQLRTSRFLNLKYYAVFDPADHGTLNATILTQCMLILTILVSVCMNIDTNILVNECSQCHLGLCIQAYTTKPAI